MRKNRNLRVFITSGIILLVLAGTAAVGKKWIWGVKEAEKEKKEEYKTVSVMDESGIGIPTDDDPWLEMEKLVKAYYGGEQQVTYHGKMRLMDDNEEKQKLVEELSFEYSSCKGDYYYRMGQLECVTRDNFILLVDHDSRTVAISPVTPAKNKSAGILSMEEFKKILEQKISGAKITQSGNDKILTVNNIQDPTIQGYQVYYDPSTYQIKKMIIGMIRLSPLDEKNNTAITDTDEKPAEETNKGAGEETEIEAYSYYLEIRYDKTERIPVSGKEFKPEQKFIRFKDGKAELQPAFVGYRLLN